MEINESLKQFLEKLAQDEELQAKMQAAENLEEAYTIASAIQSGFTKEEFVETMAAIKNQIDDELSDDDLEQVAGGSLGLKPYITCNRSIFPLQTDKTVSPVTATKAAI